MSLKSILRSMAAILPKRNLVDSVLKAQESLNDYVIPMYERSATATENMKFHSAYAKKMQQQFSEYKSLASTRRNFIATTEACLKQILANQDLIMVYVNKIKSDSLAVDALQLREVTVVNYQNALSHVIEYASRMISMFWVAEGNAARGRNQFDGQAKGEVEWLETNLNQFMRELSAISIDKRELEKKFEHISSTVFDPDEEETVKSLLPQEKMDPLGFGFIPLSINPFFIVGRWVVEWQDARYKALQLDLRRTELRIKALEEVNRGSNDPQTEKTLIALDDLRKEIQVKMNKMEAQ